MLTHSEPGELRWHALVPAKAIHSAKSRLDRNELVAAFLIDTVTALTRSPRVASVSVITSDRELATIAENSGAQTIWELNPSGLLNALELGMHTIQPSLGILVTLGDLPCLTPADVNTFLESADVYDCSFSCDSEGTGSTMWARRPGSTALPRFGPRSRATHRESGAVEIPCSPTAHRDVDTPADLWDAIRIGVGSATTSALGETKPFLATISGSDPVEAVSESGLRSFYPDYTLSGIRVPKIGQRVRIDPKNKRITVEK